MVSLLGRMGLATEQNDPPVVWQATSAINKNNPMATLMISTTLKAQHD